MRKGSPMNARDASEDISAKPLPPRLRRALCQFECHVANHADLETVFRSWCEFCAAVSEALDAHLDDRRG